MLLHHEPLNGLPFHPDGLLLGMGTTAAAGAGVLVWDLKTQKSVATMQGHKGSVTSLCFSENGFYMSTASADHAEGVKIWDLRKLQNVHTIDLGPLTSQAPRERSGPLRGQPRGSEEESRGMGRSGRGGQEGAAVRASSSPTSSQVQVNLS